LQDINLSDRDAPDEGPLVRLGEGLVVDWKAPAWEAMFGADSIDDTMRGRPTWSNPPTLQDPELTAARTSRAQRRKRGITLNDCLDEFGKEEILSEMDTWYCPRCKEHQRASKKFELWKTPDILVMHLKRFGSSGFRRDKLDVLVEFPIEGLDLSSRVIETEENKQGSTICLLSMIIGVDLGVVITLLLLRTSWTTRGMNIMVCDSFIILFTSHTDIP